MFRIINFVTILRSTAFITTLVSIAAYEFLRTYWDKDLPLLKVLSIAPWVAFAICIALTVNVIARFIWGVLRYFNGNLFPDLNGTWVGEIITSDDIKIPAKAVIRQTFLQMQIDIFTATSKSVTLETTPATEGGQCKIYYLYRSIPKELTWPEYKGSTTFDIRTVTEDSKKTLELSGTYFTSRKSVGRIWFRQESPKLADDAAYY